jgi:16S rRNA (guanine527-N7)-methyltransferase
VSDTGDAAPAVPRGTGDQRAASRGSASLLSAAPPAPAEAAEVFGPALDLAREYAGLLATDGVTRGLIGPRETERLWDRHLLNCAVVDELLPERGELVDIGSGAGLPGLVLAMMRPSLQVLLVESMLRRCVFLEECARQLGLENVQVVRGRAEDLAGTIRADIATARAVAPLDRLAGWAAGLLRPGGELLAIKGQAAAEELAAAKPALRRLHARSSGVMHAGRGRVISATTVVRVVIGGHGREEQADARRGRPGVA